MTCCQLEHVKIPLWITLWDGQTQRTGSSITKIYFGKDTIIIIIQVFVTHSRTRREYSFRGNTHVHTHPDKKIKSK